MAALSSSEINDRPRNFRALCLAWYVVHGALFFEGAIHRRERKQWDLERSARSLVASDRHCDSIAHENPRLQAREVHHERQADSLQMGRYRLVSFRLPGHLPGEALQRPGVSAAGCVDLVDVGEVPRPDQRQTERRLGHPTRPQLSVTRRVSQILHRLNVVRRFRPAHGWTSYPWWIPVRSITAPL